MAADFSDTNLLTNKLWSKKISAQALMATKASMFIGSSPDSMIYVKDELSKSAGDKVVFGLRMQLSGNGVAGDDALSGSEETLTFRNDSLIIDQLRNAVKIQGAMSQQRVPFQMRQEANSALTDWWADRVDNSLLQQLAGNAAVTNVRLTGMQATVAPSTGTMVFAAGKTAESGLTAAAQAFTLDLITKAKVKMMTKAIPGRPLRIGGMDVYVLFLHPYQVAQIKEAVSTNLWYDIQKAALQGGQITGNPIFTGALGMFDGCVMHEDIRVPWGSSTDGRAGSNLGAAAVGTTSVARAVLCGAQAANMAFGREAGWPYQIKWVEELDDFENQLGVAAGMIFGVKKTIFKDSGGANGADLATVTISSFSPAL